MEMCKFFNFFTLLAITLFFLQSTLVNSLDTSLHSAHATFYGDGGSNGLGAACGYTDLSSMGYNHDTAALSTALFNNGSSCGQCYKIICDYKSNPQYCLQETSVVITATNFCPPNYNLPSDNGGWCNPPRKHFDMAQHAFEKIANMVPASYPCCTKGRVSCVKKGGIRFTITGNDYFNLVLIWNVGGAGSIKAVWVKGSSSPWTPMPRNWGANWHANLYLKGQSLSFLVSNTYSHTILFQNFIVSTWTFGKTFEANGNFV